MKFLEEYLNLKNIKGKDTIFYLNPTKKELESLNSGDRGFILNNGDVVMIKNSGYIFHTILWDNLKNLTKYKEGYSDLINDNIIIAIQKGNDENYYLSEQYQIDKIFINKKLINEIIKKKKSKDLNFIFKFIPNSKL
jgi:hypothetical protein